MKKYGFLLGFIFVLSSYAQCNVNSHSTSWFDAWVSCETSPNPNPAYGNTHWIMYDLGYEYTLYDSKLWNINEPSHLEDGIKDYEVDYSSDGVNWTHFGSFTLEQGTGMPDYYGAAGPHFEGLNARYLLITPTDNYGGSCYGFAEIKINLDEFASTDDVIASWDAYVYPNPVGDYLNIYTDSRGTPEAITYRLYDLAGREITGGQLTENTNGVYSIQKGIDVLVPGIYLLEIHQNGEKKTLKIIKQ